MRFYSARQVHDALELGALADAIAATLLAKPVAPLRHAHTLSASDSLLLMPAWSDQALGVKLVTVMPSNSARGAATVNAIYVVFDRVSGAPQAVIDGEALTLRRTAAVSLLAARGMARADARTVLVIGTGKLAPYMAHAMTIACRPDRLWVWGRRGEGAQTMAQRLRDEGLPAQVVDDLESAVRQADVISCATTSTQPIVRGAWLAAGTHLDLVGGFRRGMREADDEAVARSRIVVDTYAGALAEAADILEPLDRGVIDRTAIVAELAELAAGTRSGRTDAEQITLFKSVGTALADLAAARLLLELTQPT
jgi:ornithine cyclodeaminase/alanine dehydrogenase-like protein (mu-crystallin family)